MLLAQSRPLDSQAAPPVVSAAHEAQSGGLTVPFAFRAELRTDQRERQISFTRSRLHAVPDPGRRGYQAGRGFPGARRSRSSGSEQRVRPPRACSSGLGAALSGDAAQVRGSEPEPGDRRSRSDGRAGQLLSGQRSNQMADFDSHLCAGQVPRGLARRGRGLLRPRRRDRVRPDRGAGRESRRDTARNRGRRGGTPAQRRRRAQNRDRRLAALPPAPVPGWSRRRAAVDRRKIRDSARPRCGQNHRGAGGRLRSLAPADDRSPDRLLDLPGRQRRDLAGSPV